LPRPRQRSVGSNVQAIRRSLASIARSLASLIRMLDSAGRTSDAPGRRGRKLRLSPARRANLKLQGQYMGYVRGLNARQKVSIFRSMGPLFFRSMPPWVPAA
jgi:hypothetical protein